jgi:hypothetical protein
MKINVYWQAENSVHFRRFFNGDKQQKREKQFFVFEKVFVCLLFFLDPYKGAMVHLDFGQGTVLLSRR